MQHTILNEGKPNIAVTFKKTFLLVTNQSGDVAEKNLDAAVSGVVNAVAPGVSNAAGIRASNSGPLINEIGLQTSEALLSDIVEIELKKFIHEELLNFQQFTPQREPEDLGRPSSPIGDSFSDSGDSSAEEGFGHCGCYCSCLPE